MNRNIDIDSEIKAMDKRIKIALDKCKKIYKDLDALMESTGINKRMKEMKQEILKMGWPAVVDRYRDVNIHDKAAKELFEMYEFVHDNMESVGE